MTRRPPSATPDPIGTACTASPERRRNRSSDPLVALHYQLTQTRAEGRFDAVVVADDSGIVVAGAGGWAVCEELAAYAPLLTRAPGGVNDAVEGGEPGGGSRLAAMRRDVDIWPVEVEGQTVILCARGGDRVADRSLERAAEGIARILVRAA
jgi:hypothetical protein